MGGYLKSDYERPIAAKDSVIAQYRQATDWLEAEPWQEVVVEPSDPTSDRLLCRQHARTTTERQELQRMHAYLTSTRTRHSVT